MNSRITCQQGKGKYKICYNTCINIPASEQWHQWLCGTSDVTLGTGDATCPGAESDGRYRRELEAARPCGQDSWRYPRSTGDSRTRSDTQGKWWRERGQVDWTGDSHSTGDSHTCSDIPGKFALTSEIDYY